MIRRTLTLALRAAAREHAVVAVTGPRQAGKTELCRAAFPQKSWVSLEAIDSRDFAVADPRGFVAEYHGGAIIDELQRAPALLPHLREEIERDPRPGRFVLTSEQQFVAKGAVAKALAGHLAALTLLPPDHAELKLFGRLPGELLETLWTGAYPRIHDRGIPPQRWLSDHLASVLQRDVRPLLPGVTAEAFTAFMRLCASRIGDDLDLKALSSAAGITAAEVRAWLAVLETSGLAVQLPAWPCNGSKPRSRAAARAARLLFVDSGLLCFLLDIGAPQQLRGHPLRSAIFECWVAMEIYKAHTNRGLLPTWSHLHDASGPAVDLVVERAQQALLVEVEPQDFVDDDFPAPRDALTQAMATGMFGTQPQRFHVYGGESGQTRGAIRVVPWHRVARERWTPG